MGLCHTKEQRERREQKKRAPLHEGEFAIPNLAPGLRELVEKNDGAPAFGHLPPEDLPKGTRFVKYRIKLKDGYELRNAKNEKMAELYRELGSENKGVIVLKSQYFAQNEKLAQYRIIIYDTSGLTRSARNRGMKYSGVVQIKIMGGHWHRIDSLYR